MKNKEKQELISRIKDVLKEQEEPYELGAWELFQQQQKRKRSGILAWRIGLGTAASFLLAFSFTFLLKENFPAPAESLAAAPVPEEKTTKQREEEQELPLLETAEQSSSLLMGKAITTKAQQENEESFSGYSQANPVKQKRPEFLTPASPERKIFDPGVSQASIELPVLRKKSNPPAIIREQAVHAPVTDNHSRKKYLSLGVVVAPGQNMQDSRAGLNLSGGIAADWKFSRDFALSSGVLLAQNQLAYDMEKGTNSIASNEQTSVQVDLLSLEVPISLRYFVSDRLSVSAGISSAAYLKEKYQYEHQYQREVQVLTLSEDNVYQISSQQLTFTELEVQRQPSFSTADWAAFYTFSIGYQSEISEKFILGIEPFVKLPTGRIAFESMEYTSGGIQLKISF